MKGPVRSLQGREAALKFLHHPLRAAAATAARREREKKDDGVGTCERTEQAVRLPVGVYVRMYVHWILRCPRLACPS